MESGRGDSTSSLVRLYHLLEDATAAYRASLNLLSDLTLGNFREKNAPSRLREDLSTLKENVRNVYEARDLLSEYGITPTFNDAVRHIDKIYRGINTILEQNCDLGRPVVATTRREVESEIRKYVEPLLRQIRDGIYKVYSMKEREATEEEIRKVAAERRRKYGLYVIQIGAIVIASSYIGYLLLLGRSTTAKLVTPEFTTTSIIFSILLIILALILIFRNKIFKKSKH